MDSDFIEMAVAKCLNTLQPAQLNPVSGQSSKVTASRSPLRLMAIQSATPTSRLAESRPRPEQPTKPKGDRPTTAQKCPKVWCSKCLEFEQG